MQGNGQYINNRSNFLMSSILNEIRCQVIIYPKYNTTKNSGIFFANNMLKLYKHILL
jgi:hypothetical protein